MIDCDYAEALEAEFYMKVQSKEFGFFLTTYIEDITCEYHDKDQDDVRNKQNVKTDFTHIFQMNLLKMQLLLVNTKTVLFTGCMRVFFHKR